MAGADGKLVTVFGGSGFVGRHVVAALSRRGYRIRAACRRPDLAGHLQPMGAVGQIHAVQANLRYPESVSRAIAGADAVINAVGVLASIRKQTFDAVHAGGAAAVAQAAADHGVSRLVHISAIGADPHANADYAKSKAAGEAAVFAAVPSALILRPSIVFGPEDEFFNRFAAMARVSPALPLIGSGLTRFQPVYVGDLASAVANAVEGAGTDGTVYEIGGPQILDFRQLLELTLAYAGRQRALVPIPFAIAKVMAVVTAILPNSMRPMTLDQVRLLQTDNVVSDDAVRDGRTLEQLGVSAPTSIAAVVPGYLERFKPRGQFAHYKAS